MRKLSKRNLFFRNFFLSNIAILLLPLFIGLISYASMYRIVEDEVINSNRAMLQNAGSVVDKTMEEIQNIASRLALDGQVQNFVNLEPLDAGSSKLISVRDAWIKLSDYKLKLTNNYIIDMAIHSHSSGVTISSTIPYSKYPFFYGAMFTYGDLEYGEWKGLFLDRSHNHDFLSEGGVTLMGKRYNAIVYLQSIPMGAVNRRRGTLFSLIDADGLRKLLSPIQYSPESAVVVLDGNNRPLLNTNETLPVSLSSVAQAVGGGEGSDRLQVGGKTYILTFCRSSFSKWTYVSLHPEEVIGQKLIALKNTLLWLAAGSVAAGLLLVTYLSWRNANPINEIYQTIAGNKIQPPMPTRRSYDYLKGSIAWLIQDQSRLRERMDRQLPLLQASYFKQLLGNEFISRTEMKAYAQNAGLEMEYRGYLCAIVSTAGIGNTDDAGELQQIDIATMLVQESIVRQHGDSFLLNRGTGQFVLIYCDDTDDEAALYGGLASAIDRALSELRQKYDIPVRVDVGIPVFEQTDCFRSYQSAMAVSEYRDDNCSGPVLWYKDIVMTQESYRFPVETEIQLVNHIKEGKTNNVQREIDHLLSENLERRNLSAEKRHQFVNTLLLIATRLNEELEPAMQIDVPASGQLSLRHKEHVGRRITELYVGLARRFEDAINSKQARLQDRIVEFVARRYQDPGLTLYAAASEFCMTESAVYAFIRKHLKMTFADYLESVRIRNACLMLMNGENVNDISARVGYTSPHSFRRAFKRIKGVTPTLYKELMQESAAMGACAQIKENEGKLPKAQ